ncbi:MAG: hypothetical protein AAGG69_02150 [Pseudomonadota bacterium]
MDMIDQLIKASDAYCAAMNLSRGRLSTLMLGAGHRLDTIATREGDIGVKRAGDALKWLSARWPQNAAWPDDVPRPDPAEVCHD